MENIKSKWRDFNEARSWAQSLGLQSEKYWRLYRKDGLPSDIPSNPNREYADKWQGWGDWLGTGRVADKNKIYRSYQEASNWAKEQGIKKLEDWKLKTKDKDFPKDIPIVPYNTYKNDWTNWGDFLQTGYVHYKQRSRASYEDAKSWAEKMGVLRKEDWDELSKNGLIPPEIPVNVSKFYKEWKSWSEFLGNQIKGGASITEVVIGLELSQFLEVDDSVRSLKLKDGKLKRIDIAIPKMGLLIEYDGAHWHKNLVEKDFNDNVKLKEIGWTVLRIRERPLEIVSEIDVLVNPNDSLFNKVELVILKLIELNYLKDSEKLFEYLSSKKLSVKSSGLKSQTWMTYEEAKGWIKDKNITSETKWRKFKSDGILPNNFPASPEDAYRTDWISWGDFLGTGRVSDNKVLRSFSEARELVRSLGIKNSREWKVLIKKGSIPRDIPSNPHNAYSEFISWMDWLGTEKTARNKRQWIHFDEAVLIARGLNLKSETEWRIAKKNKTIPKELPLTPQSVYKDCWKGWGYWLGTGNKKRGEKIF